MYFQIYFPLLLKQYVNVVNLLWNKLYTTIKHNLVRLPCGADYNYKLKSQAVDRNGVAFFENTFGRRDSKLRRAIELARWACWFCQLYVISGAIMEI